MPWRKEDEIRWVEQRVREREGIEQEQKDSIPHSRQRPDWNKSGKFSKVVYLAWLLHERDRLAHELVGERLFTKESDDRDCLEAGDKLAGEPERRKMRAYRAWRQVEWEFGRGRLKRKRQPSGFAILGGQIVCKPTRGQARPTGEVKLETSVTVVTTQM